MSGLLEKMHAYITFILILKYSKLLEDKLVSNNQLL